MKNSEWENHHLESQVSYFFRYFLGNFTPRTSNYCLKNSALGVAGRPILLVIGLKNPTLPETNIAFTYLFLVKELEGNSESYCTVLPTHGEDRGDGPLTCQQIAGRLSSGLMKSHGFPARAAMKNPYESEG